MPINYPILRVSHRLDYCDKFLCPARSPRLLEGASFQPPYSPKRRSPFLSPPKVASTPLSFSLSYARPKPSGCVETRKVPSALDTDAIQLVKFLRMRRAVFILFLFTAISAQSTTENRVLERIRHMIQRQGQVTFSDLYNNPDFNDVERMFLGRLYEIFFAIPDFLLTRYENTEKIPSRSELALHFGITIQSTDLLLAVMESDPRVPKLFERNPQNHEIQSLRLDHIKEFTQRRGSEVKVTRWEGQMLPGFELTTFGGEQLSNRDLTGQNVLLYFWFTGCPPCVKLAPILADLNHQYNSSNFRLVGVNADRVLELEVADQARQSYLSEHDLDFLNVHLDRTARRSFGNVQVFPTLFFVGPDGTIFRHLINYQSPETLQQILEELLAHKSSPA